MAQFAGDQERESAHGCQPGYVSQNEQGGGVGGGEVPGEADVGGVGGAVGDFDLVAGLDAGGPGGHVGAFAFLISDVGLRLVGAGGDGVRDLAAESVDDGARGAAVAIAKELFLSVDLAAEYLRLDVRPGGECGVQAVGEPGEKIKRITVRTAQPKVINFSRAETAARDCCLGVRGSGVREGRPSPDQVMRSACSPIQ